MARNIVLFGATGFVGRNILAALAARGDDVTAVSRSGACPPGAARGVAMDDLDTAELPVDDAVVIHVAAQRYDASRFEMAQSDILSANVELTNRVFAFCAARGIKEVRMASSVAVYQAGLAIMDDASPVDLNAPPHRNEAFYAWSKRWAEITADLFAERYGVSTVAFRLSNPYGPFDSIDTKAAHVAPAFVMRALSAGDSFALQGDPEVERDFIYVDDVVHVFLKSLDWRGRTETYNLCSGQTTTLRRLAEMAIAAAGTGKSLKLDAEFAPAAVRARRSSSDRVREAFGITAFTPLDQGLKATTDWYRKALADA
ncbi:MAG TPA: NAD(P)-dependent oxidoreductase [Caulobacter sp.]|nr:NAD(P)-dependent oxidoreductase [Caulobacter sp.]